MYVQCVQVQSLTVFFAGYLLFAMKKFTAQAFTFFRQYNTRKKSFSMENIFVPRNVLIDLTSGGRG